MCRSTIKGTAAAGMRQSHNLRRYDCPSSAAGTGTTRPLEACTLCPHHAGMLLAYTRGHADPATGCKRSNRSCGGRGGVINPSWRQETVQRLVRRSLDVPHASVMPTCAKAAVCGAHLSDTESPKSDESCCWVRPFLIRLLLTPERHDCADVTRWLQREKLLMAWSLSSLSAQDKERH